MSDLRVDNKDIQKKIHRVDSTESNVEKQKENLYSPTMRNNDLMHKRTQITKFRKTQNHC